MKFIPKWCPAWWPALLCDSGSWLGPPSAGASGSRVPTPPPLFLTWSRSDPPAHGLPGTREAQRDELPRRRLPGPGSYFLFRSALGRAWGSARCKPLAGPH
ncbi:hypothetical protein I79_021551 [Cricetulus griseus]|uniref:Uncharacterized protein n=1 Tax=Cricetulus griseus TaxID=10029 RepID=G3ICZ0_CRIGR|nr:hypothetical protein I79_021551 [Cricetulus griseus]